MLILLTNGKLEKTDRKDIDRYRINDKNSILVFFLIRL